MPFIDTPIKGLKIFEPKVFNDSRGYFYESFNQQTYHDAGIMENFVQDNQSFSQKNSLRGLHYQLNPHAQSKLVRVVLGSVMDVVVDIRKWSETFGKSYSILLSGDNNRQLYIPRGFAHGYSVLSDTAIFLYKCDNLYHKESERGILFNDPELNIDWGLNISDAIISDKDKSNSLFKNSEMNFIYNEK